MREFQHCKLSLSNSSLSLFFPSILNTMSQHVRKHLFGYIVQYKQLCTIRGQDSFFYTPQMAVIFAQDWAMDRRGHAVFLKTEVAPQHFPRACLSQIFPISVSEIRSHNFFPQHLNEKYWAHNSFCLITVAYSLSLAGPMALVFSLRGWAEHFLAEEQTDNK